MKKNLLEETFVSQGEVKKYLSCQTWTGNTKSYLSNEIENPLYSPSGRIAGNLYCGSVKISYTSESPVFTFFECIQFPFMTNFI